MPGKEPEGKLLDAPGLAAANAAKDAPAEPIRVGSVGPDPAARPAPQTTQARAGIQGELDAAKAEFVKLMGEVETANGKTQRRNEAIARKKDAWLRDHPDEPWDPNAFDPPMTPLPVPEDLQRRFHEAHQKIAEIEARLNPPPAPKV